MKEGGSTVCATQDTNSSEVDFFQWLKYKGGGVILYNYEMDLIPYFIFCFSCYYYSNLKSLSTHTYGDTNSANLKAGFS